MLTGASKSQTQLAEDRKSKFINRELPPLPWEAGEQQRRRDSCNSTNSADDDVNHLYELLPVSAQGKQAAEKKKKVAIADSVQQRDDVPVLPPRDKILDDKLATQNALGRSPRRPISKPSEQSSSPATSGNSSSKRTHGSSYVMVYFDDTVSPGEQLRCALSPDQALAKMAAVCLDTVQHMYEAIRKAVDVTTLAVSATEEINFAHITLLNTTAELIQGQAFFYRVSCSLLGLDSSLVMVSALRPRKIYCLCIYCCKFHVHCRKLCGFSCVCSVQPRSSVTMLGTLVNCTCCDLAMHSTTLYPPFSYKRQQGTRSLHQNQTVVARPLYGSCDMTV